MKKLPLVFSGCLLGLAGAGNLILDTLPVLSHLLSLTGLILWIYFLILHLFNWKETKQELTKPPLLSGMATFPHGWDDFYLPMSFASSLIFLWLRKGSGGFHFSWIWP